MQNSDILRVRITAHWINRLKSVPAVNTFQIASLCIIIHFRVYLIMASRSAGFMSGGIWTVSHMFSSHKNCPLWSQSIRTQPVNDSFHFICNLPRLLVVCENYIIARIGRQMEPVKGAFTRIAPPLMAPQQRLLRTGQGKTDHRVIPCGDIRQYCLTNARIHCNHRGKKT